MKNSQANPAQLDQPLLIWTAFSQRPKRSEASSSEIWGLKMVRPSRLTSFNSSKLFQTPTAKPAAMAAPRAVVSRMPGRLTGMPMMSDWV